MPPIPTQAACYLFRVDGTVDDDSALQAFVTSLRCSGNSFLRWLSGLSVLLFSGARRDQTTIGATLYPNLFQVQGASISVKDQLGFRRRIHGLRWFAGNEGRVSIRARNSQRLVIVSRRFNVVNAWRESHVLRYK